MTGTARDGTTGRRGLLLILSSPSGAGKSTLANLIKADEDLVNSVSFTTRSRRPSEVDGVHYHFIDRATFEKKRAAGEMLEWAEVHGNLYATPLTPVREALAAGRDVLFDIDWQGTQQIAMAMPGDVVRVFLLPPSMAELRHRLTRRAEDDDGVITKRLASARSEIEHWGEYDYVIINEDIQVSLATIRAILKAERTKRIRQPALEGFVAALLAGSSDAG